VTLGGRRVPVRRPRVRTVGDDEHELLLESYESFVSADLLADGWSPGCWAGCRPAAIGWAGTRRPAGRAGATGTSHSAVSRRFVTATVERLDQLLHRPLGGQRWLVVFLDGFGTGGRRGLLGQNPDRATRAVRCAVASRVLPPEPDILPTQPERPSRLPLW
jgi:hypothetical protein